ncbi:glycosyltransferase [Acidihalobacter ferrooxydans]|uniref:Glycosyl transferase family 1 domain-containing protein n=1 Tax=Acidihalobacter ferrooxydans TaxID=1765967 RepID=A0A1P8UI26_9GAMM|nr:glycosyltransferase [Acidihalobacter ferrooxydans]APZ43479.1 hypothetical protein BW247_10580 [Acidihalobacter ferrooxydans]
MIHFLVFFSNDAGDTEFGRALKRISVEHEIFSCWVDMSYQSRLKHLLVNLPRLAICAAKMASISLSCKTTPEYAVLGSDIEIMAYVVMRSIKRKKTQIAFSSFIFTQRNSRFLNFIRRLYYSILLDRAAVVVVHSTLELERYSKLFPKAQKKFRFIPWSGYLEQRSNLIEIAKNNKNKSFTIISAGRSGRDYATLYASIKKIDPMLNIDVEIKIVCDHLASSFTSEGLFRSRITVLQNHYGMNYLREITKADIVIIPLGVSDISAGQMVLIQSMALAKAIIVTDVPTIRDYVTHRHDAWLVKPYDADDLGNAILTLMSDGKLRDDLGQRASETYDTNHNVEAQLNKLVSELTPIVPA